MFECTNYAEHTSGSTIQVDKTNCDRLTKHCYGYLKSRSEGGEMEKEKLMRQKMRKRKGNLEEKSKKVE